MYHNKVRDAVRQVNKIDNLCKMHGVHLGRKALRNKAFRREWMAGLEEPFLCEQLNVMWMGLDTVSRQVELCRKQLSARSSDHEIIEYWQQIPGIGLIRSTTLLAYLDTPWRFSSEKKLWRYCSLGLQRTASGTDRLGRPNKGHLKLAWSVNRRLKNVAMGAAMSAINQKKNVFAYKYERLIQNGLTQNNAHHAVARKMLSVMWAMWKTKSRFDESLVYDCPPVKGH